MAEWGNPQDYKMEQVRNAMRDVYEGTDWYKLPYQNYTSQNKPANSFAQGFANIEQNQNPSSPVVDNKSVQTTNGEQSVPQSKYQEMVNRLASSKYLGDDYQFDNWAQRAQQEGITGDATQNVMYRQRIKPLIDAAREDRLRESFRIANDPQYANTPVRTEALAELSYLTKNANLVNDIAWKQESHDMEKEKFNHMKEMWPYDIEGRRLSNQSKQLGIQGQKQNLINNQFNFDEKMRQKLGRFAGLNLEGDTWFKKDNSVNTDDLAPETRAGLNYISSLAKQKFGKPLMVTSGRDSDKHQGGQYSHYTGHKLDVAFADDENGNPFNDPANRKWFADECAKVGIYMNDEWVPGNEHLDLNFQNYRGDTTTTQEDPFNSMHYGAAIYEWNGGKDGTGKPNAELAKVIATKFVSDYKQAYNKNGGNRERAIQSVIDKISKDKQISDPINGDAQLLWTIANEAASQAHGQTGTSQQGNSTPTGTGTPLKEDNVGGNGYVPERPPYADEDGVEYDGYNERRRAELIKNAEEEGLEFNPWTNELQAKGSSTMWDRLLKSKNEMEPQNEKIRRFKEQNLLR